MPILPENMRRLMPRITPGIIMGRRIIALTLGWRLVFPLRANDASVPIKVDTRVA
jgi:nitrogen fixation protein